MLYAPIIITTLCRYEHFCRCINSLAANPLAIFTDVYIGLDYPANDSHVEGHAKINKFISNFDTSKFNKFVVFKRDVNYGSSKNFKDVIKYVLDRYDRFIFSEDDVEFSPAFLGYINTCLHLFENDPSVDSISGYSYPLDWHLKDGCNSFFCNSTFSAWGYATWKSKYFDRLSYIEGGGLDAHFIESCKKGSIYNLINNRLVEYVQYSGLLADPGISRRAIDITSAIYLMLAHKYVIAPSLSLTRNWGFDGSGVYCDLIENPTGLNSQDYDYTNQPLCLENSFVPVVDRSIDSIEFNNALLNDFLYVDKDRLKLSKLIVKLVSIFGERGLICLRCFYSIMRRR